MNDLIADLLTRIQNAIMRKKDSVLVVNTKINSEILRVLKEEEMVGEYNQTEDGRMIEVNLLYVDNDPVITTLKRKSKLGQRIYTSSKEIKPIMNGRGISIISTSRGLMTGAYAKNLHLGGELICEIY